MRIISSFAKVASQYSDQAISNFWFHNQVSLSILIRVKVSLKNGGEKEEAWRARFHLVFFTFRADLTTKTMIDLIGWKFVVVWVCENAK